MNIISDVAGQYDSLMRLVKKLPRGPLLFIGDMVDRGPDSNKVVEFAMDHMAILGNHEHMMLDYCLNQGEPKEYDQHVWYYNGGLATIRSYGLADDDWRVPQEHLNWMCHLPLIIETERFIISHAMAAMDRNPFDLMWSREFPEEEKQIKICGHNSHWGLRYFRKPDETIYGICLDDSRKRMLTALNTEQMKIYQEAY